jgi:hypothetical protein
MGLISWVNCLRNIIYYDPIKGNKSQFSNEPAFLLKNIF